MIIDYSLYLSVIQGSKLTVANVQNATDLKLFAPKLFDRGATFVLKFLKLILAWRSKFLMSSLWLFFAWRALV